MRANSAVELSLVHALHAVGQPGCRHSQGQRSGPK